MYFNKSKPGFDDLSASVLNETVDELIKFILDQSNFPEKLLTTEYIRLQTHVSVEFPKLFQRLESRSVHSL